MSFWSRDETNSSQTPPPTWSDRKKSRFLTRQTEDETAINPSSSSSPWVGSIRHPFVEASSTFPYTYTSDTTPSNPVSIGSAIPSPTLATSTTSVLPKSTTRVPESRLRSTATDAYAQSNPQGLLSRNPSSHQSVLQKLLGTLALCTVFLPVFPLLATTYMVLGHSILRAAHHHSDSTPNPTSYHAVPLSSSAKSGAVGGIILALPILILLYPFLHSTPIFISFSLPTPAHVIQSVSQTNSSRPDDFFDDESEKRVVVFGRRRSTRRHQHHHGQDGQYGHHRDEGASKTMRTIGFAVLFILVFLFGSISGPLGYGCLHAANDGRYNSQTMLSGRHAAEAGLVGGVVLGSVLVGMGLGLAILARSYFVDEE
ncbi:hypothetical protein D9758_017854 [Tetrapyrgos nigripes]|uniref:Uncharacterized protein n=1 Tax=Tetrapyrgos nigripes TaxID=182062 RepID=A0A8H5BAS9_9AGAR|nr:hypothetical protein D9758_017854 [Tetrapyrgos nigripes]